MVERRVIAQLEVGFDPVLGRCDPQLFDAEGLEPDRRRQQAVGQQARRATARARGASAAAARPRVARRQEPAAVGGERLEAGEVEPAGVEAPAG